MSYRVESIAENIQRMTYRELTQFAQDILDRLPMNVPLDLDELIFGLLNTAETYNPVDAD